MGYRGKTSKNAERFMEMSEQQSNASQPVSGTISPSLNAANMTPNFYGGVTLTPEGLMKILQDAGIDIPDGEYEVLQPCATEEEQGNAIAQLYWEKGDDGSFTLKVRKLG